MGILYTSILLKCDRNFFLKMKVDKAEREVRMGKTMTWKDYIAKLLGIARAK